VKGRLDLAVTDLGPIQLKNIVEPIRLYSLEIGKPAQAKPVTVPAPEKSASPHLSIVVLPFKNLSSPIPARTTSPTASLRTSPPTCRASATVS